MPARRDSIEYLRGAVFLVVAAAALAWLCVIYVVSWNVLIALHYNDFGKFYYAVLQWREGVGLYAPNPATLIRLSPTLSRQFWDLNPPHFHLLVWPLTYLSVRQASLAWMAINVCLAAGAIVAVRTELSIRLSWRGWLVAAYLALAAAPTLTWFVTGQLTGILAALGTWIWIELRRERWTRAGIAIGLACGLKLFLAPLLLYLVIRRRWSAVAAAAAAIAASFATGLLLFGLAAHHDWIVALRDVQWTWAPMNASIVAPFARITVPSPGMADARAPGLGWTAAATGVSLLVLLAGILASLRARRGSRCMRALSDLPSVFPAGLGLLPLDPRGTRCRGISTLRSATGVRRVRRAVAPLFPPRRPVGAFRRHVRIGLHVEHAALVGAGGYGCWSRSGVASFQSITLTANIATAANTSTT